MSHTAPNLSSKTVPTSGPITMVEAIRQAMFEEMERDPAVVAIGEDIGVYGGAFKVTEGLLAKFGRERVIETPISRNRHHRRGLRHELSRPAAGGRNAVHRFHRLLLQPGHQLRREIALSLGRAGAHGHSRPFRRRRPRRPISFRESRKCISCTRRG